MNGEEFVPDTIYMLPGDSIYLVFDTLGHSMVQVPVESWMAETPDPLIGFSLGQGTPNPGDFHTFVIDSLGTFYFLCMQHPDEKGVIMVDPTFTGIMGAVLPVIEIYPQPAFDILYLDRAPSFASLMIADQFGRVVRSSQMPQQRSIELGDLSVGSYFITLLDKTGTPIARQQFMVVR
ncbi:MAG: hypothetical protein M3R08_12130 [Bacteroidota bacterium]|nr:hypothetical protein [Bacteroidota bacterium]